MLNRDPYGKLPEHAQGTSLYNAVFEAAAQGIMSRQHGRKAIVVLSDGSGYINSLEVPLCRRRRVPA